MNNQGSGRLQLWMALVFQDKILKLTFMINQFLRNAGRLISCPRLLIGYVYWLFKCRRINIGERIGFLGYFSSFSQWWAYRTICPLPKSYIKFIIEKMAGGREVVCVDIGANIGLHSIAWSHLTSNSCIYAFEPMPSNLKELRKNVAANKAQNVKIINTAVAEKTGKIRFRINLGSPQNAKIDEGKTYPCEKVAEIDSVCLDDFARSEGIDVISILKIDTEGAEAKVLRGASHLLRTGRIRIVIAEFGPTQLRDFGDSAETLLSAIRVGKGNLHNFLSDGSLSGPLTDIEIKQLSGGDIVFIAN